MAEKSFGVKEISFVGSTPKINSLSNLNLNAVNVAISTNATIGGTLSVTGNVSVGGVLTYEDVTNIDSVGLITARSGIVVKDDATFETANSNNIVFDKSDNALEFGNGVKSVFNNNLQIYNDGNNRFKGSSGGMFFGLPGSFQIGDGNFSNTKFEATGTHAILYSAGVKVARSHENRFEVGNPEVSAGIGATISTIGNAQFVGVVTASSFIGSGANLTGIAVTEAPVTDYTITGDGSHYYFHGGGVDETAGDPDLYLIRGQKYRFNNTTGSSHPFEFRAVSNGSPYTNGVTGDDEGVQFFTVPYDAPAKIFYICTVHSGMVGNIYIRGAGGQNDNIGVTTFTGRVTISSAAPNLLFTETDANPDWGILCSAGQMKFQDMTNTANILTLDDDKIQAVKNLDAMAGVDVTGKIGVNVTSPTTNLQIGDGTVNSNNVIKFGKRVSSNEGNLPLIGHHSHNGSASSLALSATSSSGCIHFFTGNDADGFGDGNNEERLRITSGGNLRLGLDSVAEQTDSAHYIMTLTGKSGQTGAGAIAFKDPSANTDGFIFADSGNLFITSDYSNATADSSIRFRIDGSSEKVRITSDGDVAITTRGSVEGVSKLNVEIPARTTAFNAADGDTWHDVLIENPGAAQTNAVGLCFQVTGDLYHKNAGTGIAAVKNGTNSDYGADLVFITRGQSVVASEKMRISSKGHITKPDHPCFAAKGTTNHTAGSVTHIDYTQQLFDNGGDNYDPSAGQSKFTAPVSGYYFFHATCMFDSNLTGYTYCFLDFKINGTTQGRERMMSRPSGGNFASVENSAIFYLTANQYVQVYVTQSGGSNMNVRNDYRFFEGYLIG